MALLSDILLSPEVGITLFIDSLLFIPLFIAFFYALVILKNWDKASFSEYQYKLEKQSYLVITLISLALIIKTILLPFFVYTLNELASIIPGAMCGAGVLESNIYGELTLILKSIIIILILLWLSLNRQDQRVKNYLYFKKKMWFFIIIFFLIVGELFLEILFFSNISTLSPVLCCSSIYQNNENLSAIPSHLSSVELITLFYALFIAIIISLYLKKRFFIFLFSLFYSYISYYAITYFFSTYIYELPTHKCSFCLLQSNYNYIGYYIFATLFIATFYAFNSAVFKFAQNSYKKAIIFYILFNLFVSYNFLLYVVKNGVVL